MKLLQNIFTTKLTKEKKYALLTLVIGMSFIPLFYKLNFPAINFWDEAFYAVNSAETTISNNFIVLTEYGATSKFNTKPPFAIWMQSAFMHVIGINEWSVRLPSALASLTIAIALFFFGTSALGSSIAGFTAALVFLTSDGFIGFHVARTGDLDAMVSMWIVLYCLIYLKFLLSDEPASPRIFYVTGFFVVMAFLSKSVAGFMFLPGIVICTLLSGKRKKIIRNQHLYYSAFITLIICASYYLLREHLAPGYLHMVWNSEIIRFTQNITPWHEHPPLWFISRFINETFLPYIYILPVAIAVGLFYPDNKIKTAALYIFVCSVTYLFLISFPDDKLGWYDAPLYPFFALHIGVLFFTFEKYLKKIFALKRIIVNAILLIAMLLLFCKPYAHIYSKVNDFSKQHNIGDPEASFAKKVYADGNTFNYKIFYVQPVGNNELQLYFYKRACEYNKNIKVDICDSISQFKINDTVMVCQQDKKEALEKKYDFKIINSWNNCMLVVINNAKGIF